MDIAVSLGMTNDIGHQIAGAMVGEITTTDEQLEAALFPPMPADDLRIVLEHTNGPMAGIHSICGLQSELEGAPLPEICDAVDLLDAPSMRMPGPVSLVAVKRKYVLYRQTYAPSTMVGRAQPNAPFNRSQV